MKSSLLLAFLATFALAQAPKQLTPDTVVAKIEGKDVTLGEVRKILESSPPQMTQLFQRDPQAALANYFALRYLAAEGESRSWRRKAPSRNNWR